MSVKLMIILGVVFVVLIGIVLLIFLLKRKNRKTREFELADRRMREEALNRALANPRGAVDPQNFERVRRPVRVEYEALAVSQRSVGRRERMFELSEITDLSRRKYIYRCSELVLIGPRLGNVTILEPTVPENEAWCRIIFYEGENYLQSIGQARITLERGNKSALVSNNGLQLRSGDRIVAGNKVFQIDFMG